MSRFFVLFSSLFLELAQSPPVFRRSVPRFPSFALFLIFPPKSYGDGVNSRFSAFVFVEIGLCLLADLFC